MGKPAEIGPDLERESLPLRTNRPTSSARLNVLTAHNCGVPAGSAPSGGRNVLLLTGNDVTPAADGVYAVIEGQSDTVDQVHDALRQGLVPGSLADDLVPIDAGNYLSRLLERISTPATTRGTAPTVILLLARGHDLVIAATGSSRALLLRGGDLITEYPQVPPETEGLRPHAARATARPGDHLLLLGPRLPELISGREVEEIMNSYDAVDSALTWLVTLAAERSKSTVCALSLQFGPPPMVQAARDRVSARRHAPARRLGLPRAAALAGLIALAIVAAFSLYHALHATGSRHPSASGVRPAPPALPATPPAGLHALQVGAGTFLLSWQAVKGAVRYSVAIDGSQYATAAPHLLLRGRLQPGRTYVWQVREESAAHRELSSGPARVHVRLMPSTSWQLPPMHVTTAQLLVTLYNPNGSPVNARIQINPLGGPTTRRSVQVPARTGIEVALQPSGGLSPNSSPMVQATAPIEVQQSVIQGQTIRWAYAIPQR